MFSNWQNQSKSRPKLALCVVLGDVAWLDDSRKIIGRCILIFLSSSSYALFSSPSSHLPFLPHLAVDDYLIRPQGGVRLGGVGVEEVRKREPMEGVGYNSRWGRPLG